MRHFGRSAAIRFHPDRPGQFARLVVWAHIILSPDTHHAIKELIQNSLIKLYPPSGSFTLQNLQQGIVIFFLLSVFRLNYKLDLRRICDPEKLTYLLHKVFEGLALAQVVTVLDVGPVAPTLSLEYHRHPSRV